MISNDIYVALGELLSKKYDTYYLDQAPDDADCPYIQMYSSYDTIAEFKSDEQGGSMNLDVHVWHDRLDKRKEIGNIIDDICQVAKSVKIERHTVACVAKYVNILYDDTTNTSYLHGVVSLNFKYI